MHLLCYAAIVCYILHFLHYFAIRHLQADDEQLTEKVTSFSSERTEAFITYASPEDAQVAKEGTDTKLKFPESKRPCDVMLAKNQGGKGSMMGNILGSQQLDLMIFDDEPEGEVCVES